MWKIMWKGPKCPNGSIEYRQNGDLFLVGEEEAIYVGFVDSDGDIRIDSDVVENDIISGYDDVVGPELLKSAIENCDSDMSDLRQLVRAREKYGV